MNRESFPRQGSEDPSGISVIVITFNEERHIRDCLDSLLAQDWPADRYEILVVDASADATSDIVASYPRVRLIRSPKGYSIQKNAGVSAARHNILAFTDADCLIPSDWLRNIDRAFKDEELAAAGGNAYPPQGVSRFGLWSSCIGHPAGGAIGFDANVTPGPGRAEFAAGCDSAYRREAIVSVGGYHPDFQDGAEDVDISRRLRAAGFRIDYVPEMTVFHLPRPNLRSYIRWNIGVGITKHNLRRPGFLRIVLNPFFPLWLPGVLAVLSTLPGFPMIPGLFLLSSFTLFPPFLYITTKPYRLLWLRRGKIGISVAAALFAVPPFVAIRQAAIAWGEMRKWIKIRRSHARADSL